MEVTTVGKVGVTSNDTDLMRKERIELYLKLICGSVGGEETK